MHVGICLASLGFQNATKEAHSATTLSRVLSHELKCKKRLGELPIEHFEYNKGTWILLTASQTPSRRPKISLWDCLTHRTPNLVTDTPSRAHLKYSLHPVAVSLCILLMVTRASFGRCLVTMCRKPA